MIDKKRYKVNVNWYGELRTFWTHATSKAKAKGNVSRNLAGKLGVKPEFVLAYFNKGKDNILIKEA